MVAMMDLGFGLAISRQAAFTFGSTQEIVATGDFILLDPGTSGIHQLFALTRKLYLLLSASGIVVALLAYEFLSRFGNLIPPQAHGTRLAWYSIAFASVLLIFSGGSAAFLNGIGAVYQTRILAGLYQLTAGAGAGIAAWLGGGLPLMSASFSACAIVYAISVSYVLRRKISANGRQEVRLAPKGTLRRLARGALPIGAINIFGSLVYMVQSPVLGILLGPEKVVPFYLAQKIGLAFNTIAMQFAMPQLPFFTRKLGQGNYTGALDNFKKTIRRTSILVTLTSLMFYFASPWMAATLLHKTNYVDAMTLGLLTLDFFLLGLTSMGGQYVLAYGRNPFVYSAILTGTASVLLTVTLTPHLGIAALPIATLFAGLLFNYRKCIVESIWLSRSVAADAKKTGI